MIPIVFAFVMISCDRELENVQPRQADQALEAPTVVVALTERANLRYLSGEVGLAEGGTAFVVLNDGLIDEYTATERGFVSADKRVGNGFLACLRTAEPEREQLQRIRHTLRLYEGRNMRIIENHRMRVRQLMHRMEEGRQTLFLQYRAGEISREELQERLATMREGLHERMHHIRSSNADAFSRSYAILLEQLEVVLTEEQWAAFADCLEGM